MFSWAPPPLTSPSILLGPRSFICAVVRPIYPTKSKSPQRPPLRKEAPEVGSESTGRVTATQKPGFLPLFRRLKRSRASGRIEAAKQWWRGSETGRQQKALRQGPSILPQIDQEPLRNQPHRPLLIVRGKTSLFATRPGSDDAPRRPSRADSPQHFSLVTVVGSVRGIPNFSLKRGCIQAAADLARSSASPSTLSVQARGAPAVERRA